MNLLEELEISERENIIELNSASKRIKILFPKKDYLIFRDFVTSTIEIVIDDIVINNCLNDKIFIHQLGKRVLEFKYGKEYGDNTAFNDAAIQYGMIVKDFHNLYNEEKENLRIKCEEVLAEMDLIVKYYFHPQKNKNFLYGIVSGKYVNTSQTEFRNRLLIELNKTGLFKKLEQEKPKMKFIPGFSPFKAVRETFEIEQIDTLARITFENIYGLNNGYRSYSIYFSRKIEINNLILTPINSTYLNTIVKNLIETQIAHNYLEEFRNKNNFRFAYPDFVSIIRRDDFLETSTNLRKNPRLLKGTQENDIQVFIENVTVKLLVYSLFFEERIKEVMNTHYSEDQLNSFFVLLRIAVASENRIRAKIKEWEVKYGMSLFALSQAFRDVGTNEKSIGKNTQRFLIEIGSKFIDEKDYLGNVLKEQKELKMTGDYSFIE